MPGIEFCAELSANHNGSFDRAMDIVAAAASAGADLFKVQVWEPHTMCLDRGYTIDHGAWKGTGLYDLYEQAHTPWNWLPAIFAFARDLGMEPFGAAFDCRSVDYLEKLGVKRHKVASFELVDLPLIRYMATTGKPIILSTGMAEAEEIDAAIAAASPAKVTLLACTSAYPADASEANLRRVMDYGRTWGLSDHTHGVGVACAAAALGAKYIEKHLTMDFVGLDGAFSCSPETFGTMVTEARKAFSSVGQAKYGPTIGESTDLRRSLWVFREVAEGELLVLGENVTTARPALGLPPSFDLTGKRAARRIPPVTALSGELVL